MMIEMRPIFITKKRNFLLAKICAALQNDGVRHIGQDDSRSIANTIARSGVQVTEWRREMTVKSVRHKTQGARGGFLVFGLWFLVFGLFIFSGCNSFSKKGKAREPKELERTPAEQEKARVLKQIDRKFENPDAHFELGQLYQRDGLWVQAENQYNIALSFEPAHRNAQAAMVKVLQASGNGAKAKLSADIYMNQVVSSAAGSLQLALGFQKQELDDYALRCYRQALRLAPNSAKINRQIGYYYLSKNDKIQAQEYLTRSFQLNPNQSEVARELGRLGVPIRIPRKTEKSIKKLDRMVDESDKQVTP
jgi:tetratricopeptide (TPR) repeat protein